MTCSLLTQRLHVLLIMNKRGGGNLDIKLYTKFTIYNAGLRQIHIGAAPLLLSLHHVSIKALRLVSVQNLSSTILMVLTYQSTTPRVL